MKEILKQLSEKLGKEITEENVVGVVADLLSEKDKEIKELKPHAEDGKAYRKHLVDDVIRLGAMIDEVSTEPDKQKEEEDFIATWPIERLKMQKDKYEARARKKYPDKFTFKSKDEEGRIAKEKEAENNKPKTGKKDFTDPKNNELINTAGV